MGFGQSIKLLKLLRCHGIGRFYDVTFTWKRTKICLIYISDFARRSNIIKTYLHVLSCQPRVTVTSLFVYKVLRDSLSINLRVIYRFALAQVVCTS